MVFTPKINNNNSKIYVSSLPDGANIINILHIIIENTIFTSFLDANNN